MIEPSVQISFQELSALARAAEEIHWQPPARGCVAPPIDWGLRLEIAWRLLLEKASVTRDGWLGEEKTFNPDFSVSLEEMRQLHDVKMPEYKFERLGTDEDVVQMLDVMIGLDVDTCVNRQLVRDGYFAASETLLTADLPEIMREGATERADEIKVIFDIAVCKARAIKLNFFDRP